MSQVPILKPDQFRELISPLTTIIQQTSSKDPLLYNIIDV